MDSREEAARRICRVLTGHGYTAYLAGGCVRDLLLGVQPLDYDVATSATPEQVAAAFPRTEGVGAAFGVMLVMQPEGVFEVATFRSDGDYLDGRHPSAVRFTSAEEDALRRDFTVNALFLDPHTNEVIDYVGGRADMEARLLRAVGDPVQRFQEDHLRLLRAVRFAARLHYAIAPETFAAIKSLKHCIQRTSAERIRDEILKMLTEGHASGALRLLDETGLLEEVLPEVAAMKGVPQPPEFHPEGDVFVHTLLMLEHLNRPDAVLAMAALLHDSGKPGTFTEGDRIRFNGHDALGAEIAREVCQRLKMSNRDTARIAWLVREHMHVAHIPGMRESKRKRFVGAEGFDDLLELCRADCMASHQDLSLIREIVDYLTELAPEAVRPPRLLDGDDLKALGMAPGPRYKEILLAVEDQQLEARLSTKEEALAWVRQEFLNG
jgi:poly(A) polymerase